MLAHPLTLLLNFTFHSRLSGNRARQPAAVTPRTHPFSTTTPAPLSVGFESSTPFPVVSLPSRVTLPNRNTNPPSPSIAQPVQPVSRPRIPQATAKPPFSKISPDGDYVYEYVYEYEDDSDDFDTSPKLVDSIDEYDLNPLTSKVIYGFGFN